MWYNCYVVFVPDGRPHHNTSVGIKRAWSHHSHELSKPIYNRLRCGTHKISCGFFARIILIGLCCCRRSWIVARSFPCQLHSLQFAPMGLLISSWQTILYGLRWQKVIFPVNTTVTDHGWYCLILAHFSYKSDFIWSWLAQDSKRFWYCTPYKNC